MLIYGNMNTRIIISAIGGIILMFIKIVILIIMATFTTLSTYIIKKSKEAKNNICKLTNVRYPRLK